MLAIFFAFVLVCAFFFAIGFSLGRRTASAIALNSSSGMTGTPSTIVRPSPAKNAATPTPSSPTDFSFYKAVGAKSADSRLAPQDSTKQDSSTQTSKAQPTSSPAAAPSTDAPANTAPDAASAASVSAGYYVQVAAVTRQEDADALVEALKKKQYPAFDANNASVDKFYRVQVGPYADIKDAEAMRARLISDGYNPIVKK
jgi:cell division septation protein DedD